MKLGEISYPKIPRHLARERLGCQLSLQLAKGLSRPTIAESYTIDASSSRESPQRPQRCSRLKFGMEGAEILGGDCQVLGIRFARILQRVVRAGWPRRSLGRLDHPVTISLSAGAAFDENGFLVIRERIATVPRGPPVEVPDTVPEHEEP